MRFAISLVGFLQVGAELVADAINKVKTYANDYCFIAVM